MNHIAVRRMIELYREGVVQDEDEAQHLRDCENCRILLRKFAEDRGKTYRIRAGDTTSEAGQNFSKSA
jgi:hypothetical protein